MKNEENNGAPGEMGVVFFPLEPFLLIHVLVFVLVGAAAGEGRHLRLAPCRYEATGYPIPNTCAVPTCPFFLSGRSTDSYEIRIDPTSGIAVMDLGFSGHVKPFPSEWTSLMLHPARTFLFPFRHAVRNSTSFVRAKLAPFLILWKSKLPGGEPLALWGLLHHDYLWLFLKVHKFCGSTVQGLLPTDSNFPLRKAPVKIRMLKLNFQES